MSRRISPLLQVNQPISTSTQAPLITLTVSVRFSINPITFSTLTMITSIRMLMSTKEAA